MIDNIDLNVLINKNEKTYDKLKTIYDNMQKSDCKKYIGYIFKEVDPFELILPIRIPSVKETVQKDLKESVNGICTALGVLVDNSIQNVENIPEEAITGKSDTGNNDYETDADFKLTGGTIIEKTDSQTFGGGKRVRKLQAQFNANDVESEDQDETNQNDSIKDELKKNITYTIKEGNPCNFKATFTDKISLKDMRKNFLICDFENGRLRGNVQFAGEGMYPRESDNQYVSIDRVIQTGRYDGKYEGRFKNKVADLAEDTKIGIRDSLFYIKKLISQTKDDISSVEDYYKVDAEVKDNWKGLFKAVGMATTGKEEEVKDLDAIIPSKLMDGENDCSKIKMLIENLPKATDILKESFKTIGKIQKIKNFFQTGSSHGELVEYNKFQEEIRSACTEDSATFLKEWIEKNNEAIKEGATLPINHKLVFLGRINGAANRLLSSLKRDLKLDENPKQKDNEKQEKLQQMHFAKWLLRYCEGMSPSSLIEDNTTPNLNVPANPQTDNNTIPSVDYQKEIAKIRTLVNLAIGGRVEENKIAKREEYEPGKIKNITNNTDEAKKKSLIEIVDKDKTAYKLTEEWWDIGRGDNQDSDNATATKQEKIEPNTVETKDDTMMSLEASDEDDIMMSLEMSYENGDDNQANAQEEFELEDNYLLQLEGAQKELEPNTVKKIDDLKQKTNDLIKETNKYLVESNGNITTGTLDKMDDNKMIDIDGKFKEEGQVGYIFSSVEKYTWPKLPEEETLPLINKSESINQELSQLPEKNIKIPTNKDEIQSLLKNDSNAKPLTKWAVLRAALCTLYAFAKDTIMNGEEHRIWDFGKMISLKNDGDTWIYGSRDNKRVAEEYLYNIGQSMEQIVTKALGSEKNKLDGVEGENLMEQLINLYYERYTTEFDIDYVNGNYYSHFELDPDIKIQILNRHLTYL